MRSFTHEYMSGVPSFRRIFLYLFYSGPIGINLGMLKAPLHYYDNVSACSLCYSCQNVSSESRFGRPDLSLATKTGWLGSSQLVQRLMSGGMKVLMEHPSLFNLALARASWVNSFPRSLVYNGLNDWEKEHEMPQFAKESFNEMWKK